VRAARFRENARVRVVAIPIADFGLFETRMRSRVGGSPSSKVGRRSFVQLAACRGGSRQRRRSSRLSERPLVARSLRGCVVVRKRLRPSIHYGEDADSQGEHGLGR
jgi:hypothetical protein